MRWVYVIIIAAVFVHLATMQPPSIERTGIAEKVFEEVQVPNTVSGILLRNRLYDTAFEVLVFALAVLGVQYAFSMHRKAENVFQLTDPVMVMIARIGAMMSMIIFMELALRGHLAPGGGFAAGVAGGTALGLVVLTGNAGALYERYRRWHMASMEKCIVILILGLAILSVLHHGFQLFGHPLCVLLIPLLNLLIALKVAIGSWIIVLLFIRHRGLL